MSAAAHGKPMFGASAHLIASTWTSANTFRRSLALNLTRMPPGMIRWERKAGHLSATQGFGGKIPKRWAMLMAAGALWTWSFS